MKELFVVFSKNGVNHNNKSDFNANGEFHGVCFSMWDKANIDEEKFWSYKNVAEIDVDADRKIRES